MTRESPAGAQGGLRQAGETGVARLPVPPALERAPHVCRRRDKAGTLCHPVLLPFHSTVNRHRAIAVALALLVSSMSPVYGDAQGGDSPGAGDSAPDCGDECLLRSEDASASAGADWEEIRQKSREALEAWKQGAGAAARSAWSATREKSEETWAATEEVSGDTLDAVSDRSVTVIDSARKGAEQVWEDAGEESKQLWLKAKPKVSGTLTQAAREGEKAWDAAQQAGRTFWQVLTAEDAGEEEE